MADDVDRKRAMLVQERIRLMLAELVESWEWRGQRTGELERELAECRAELRQARRRRGQG